MRRRCSGFPSPSEEGEGSGVRASEHSLDIPLRMEHADELDVIFMRSIENEMLFKTADAP